MKTKFNVYAKGIDPCHPGQVDFGQNFLLSLNFLHFKAVTLSHTSVPYCFNSN